MDLSPVPPIVRARFGLEQRCAYRHADLYDEEVPEVRLGWELTAFAFLFKGNNSWSLQIHDIESLSPREFRVNQVDLETVIAKPEMGAECVMKSFVLLGDQNAGKSTMLHRYLANWCSQQKCQRTSDVYFSWEI